MRLFLGGLAGAYTNGATSLNSASILTTRALYHAAAGIHSNAVGRLFAEQRVAGSELATEKALRSW